ncbi:MAG: hypothetical protein M3540_03495 [Actinomycetota bacterium]|nr:hypothetical protein [Actinomycetota bacterium]
MIGWRTANDIVDLLDVDTVPACRLCLLELAAAMHVRRAGGEIAAVLATTCDWIWLETDTEIEARIARLSMRGVPSAEAAARDVRLNGSESRVVRVLVARLARRMADELGSRDPPQQPATVLPFGA